MEALVSVQMRMCGERDWAQRPGPVTKQATGDFAASVGGLHLGVLPLPSDKDPLVPRDTLTLQSQPDLMKAYSCNPRKTVSKGWAMYSDEDIPIAEVVIVEGPTCVFATSSGEVGTSKFRKRGKSGDIEEDYLQEVFDKLSNEQQGDIMSLHNSHTGHKGSTLWGIFWTNVFKVSWPNKLAAIYIFCSRMNHSCDPSCSFTFPRTRNPGDTRPPITITARRDIRAGEELTISYVPLKMRLGRRQDLLFAHHGFICDCPRCISEADKLYNWPYEEQWKVMLRFSPARPMQAEAGVGQGWDFHTVIVSISNEGGIIQGGKLITREPPLILLPKDKVRGSNSGKVLYERFSKLSGSMRNKYLRLYNWRVGQSSPVWRSGPLYEVETTDEENEPIGRFNAWTRSRKPLPSNATLLGIWEANYFTLGQEMEGVFAFTSHLDHSCWPACRVVWDAEQETLDLVATRPLKVGDKITICYNHREIINLPFEQRQQFLMDHYGFECCCIRCSSFSTEPPANRLSSLRPRVCAAGVGAEDCYPEQPNECSGKN